MGRARRRKAERYIVTGGDGGSLKCECLLVDSHPPRTAYRLFREEWQADSLTAGNVWVSTLEACRQYEDAERGDAGEGTLAYHSGDVIGDSSSPVIQTIAERVGIQISGSLVKNLMLIQNTRHVTLPDAYVICMTERPTRQLQASFGNYCVRIDNPWAFFQEVTKALGNYGTLRQAALGHVKYADCDFEGLAAVPGQVGFVKPSDPYESQREIRMLWLPSSREALKPFLVRCAAAAKLCRRVF